MRKNRAIISGMVFSALTLSPLTGWSQSSPGTSGPSGTGIERDQQRPRPSDSSARSGTDTMGRSSMSGQWSQEDVRSVQEALKGKGHDPGPIDGVIGPRTQQALRAFQRKQNIQTSGQLDSSTASALGVTLSSGSSSTPSVSTPGSSSRGSSGIDSPGSSNRGSSGTDSPGSGTPSGSSRRDSSGMGSSSGSSTSEPNKKTD